MSICLCENKIPHSPSNFSCIDCIENWQLDLTPTTFPLAPQGGRKIYFYKSIISPLTEKQP